MEKRDRYSRNNVLHLWPCNIHELRAIGAKKFYGKFCAGSIDHISIRQLQCILLKVWFYERSQSLVIVCLQVCLLLGVEVFEGVGFEELMEPVDMETGWRARVSPADHPVRWVARSHSAQHSIIILSFFSVSTSSTSSSEPTGRETR